MSQDVVIRISSAVLLGAFGFALSTLIDGPVRSLLAVIAFAAVGWFGVTSVHRLRIATVALVGGAVGAVVGLGFGALWIIIDERVGGPISEGAEGPTFLALALGLAGFIAGAMTSGWWASRRGVDEHVQAKARRD